MPEIICIKLLKKKHSALNYCVGRKESECCQECRKEREEKEGKRKLIKPDVWEG